MRPVHDPVGNPRKSLAEPDEQPENLIPYEPPPPPANLGEYGVSVWDDLWKIGEGVYNTETDRFVVERYASLQERRNVLLGRIDEQGYLMVGSQGQDVLNPLVRVVQDIEAKLIALEDRLGLSPEARLRLGISAAEHKSALEDFIDRKSSSGDATT